jgi:hypothetical protein
MRRTAPLLGIFLLARPPRPRPQTGSLPHCANTESISCIGFGNMRSAVCKVQLKIRKAERAMLVRQLLIGAQCGQADATPPPKGNRDAQLPRKSEKTVISLGFDTEKIQIWLPSYAACISECELCEEDVLTGITGNIGGYVGLEAISGSRQRIPAPTRRKVDLDGLKLRNTKLLQHKRQITHYSHL